MIKITIIQVGKTKAEYEILINEFAKRIQGFADLEIKILNEAKTDDQEKNKNLEGEKIIELFDKDSLKICLDVKGKEFDSITFANFIKEEKDFGKGKITFIIGGAFGLSKEILDMVDMKISLSQLTFTHQFAKIILLEQIYRAFTIINGKIYHY